MSLSDLPLSYCTNVHPGRTVAQVKEGLHQYARPVRKALDRPLAAGLWLARSVVNELLTSTSETRRFRDELHKLDLTCHTLNAFPYGDFHEQRVKEKVYLPGWARAERLSYTLDCAKVLSHLLPEGGEGSISTMPLGFKPFLQPPQFMEHCCQNLIRCAEGLDRIRHSTGKVIRLAIEPEPLCLLETTQEAIDFFKTIWSQAQTIDKLDVVREHLGLCFDVCHQAVEFENVGDSIGALAEAGVRINKVHVSCALQWDSPGDPEGRDALRRYIEPRYLHQTFAKLPDGKLATAVDLNADLLDHPDSSFQSAPAWRVHFHVPVNAETLGPLKTTRPALREALTAVRKLDYAPHLEVETYTWNVLPGQEKTDLVEGLTQEMQATHELLAQVAHVGR